MLLWCRSVLSRLWLLMLIVLGLRGCLWLLLMMTQRRRLLGGRRSLCGNLDHNVGGFTHYFGLETLLGICGVGNGTNKPVRINDGVAALDHIAVTGFLAILIVRKLIIFYIKTKLVRWILLQTEVFKKIIIEIKGVTLRYIQLLSIPPYFVIIVL